MKYHVRDFALGSVLAIPSFRYLWIGQIFSQLAMNMLLFVLSLIVYQNTGSNAAVSALFLSYGIPAVAVGLVAGTIVDRLDRRLVLLFCDLTRSVLVFASLALLQIPAAAYILVFVNALLNQLYVPAEAPLIPRFVPKHLLVSANSLFSFTYYCSMGLGFMLAGPFIRLAGSWGALGGIAALFLVAAIAVSLVPGERSGMAPLERAMHYSVGYLLQRMWALVREGVGYIRQTPVIRDALLLLTGTQIILALLGALGPGFADTVLEIGILDISFVMVAPVVAGILAGALWVGSRGYRWGTAALIQTGIFSAGILLVAIALTVRVSHIAPWLLPKKFLLPVELVLFFLLGVGNSLLDVPANSILQEYSKGPMRGRIYGMLAAAVGGVGMLPVVAGGVLADAVGVGKVIFFLGVVIIGYGLLRMRYNKVRKAAANVPSG